MAEEAAHAAALQAFQDAMRQGGGGNGIHDPGLDQTGSSTGPRIGGHTGRDEIFASDDSRSTQFMQNSTTLEDPQVDMLQRWIGLSPTDRPSDNATAQELLRLLEQQQQQQQQLMQQEHASMLAAQEVLRRRPEIHYLTIAHNGKCSASKFSLKLLGSIFFLIYSSSTFRNRARGYPNCNRLPTRSFVNDISL
jgi:hypothetical protein